MIYSALSRFSTPCKRMSKFIFSIFFLLYLIADVQGRNTPDELWGSNFLNKINTVRDKAKMKCLKCDHMNKEGKCLKGEGICFPTPSEECMMKKVYEGGKLQYIVQGCELLCWPSLFSVHNNEVQFECCHDKPLCNVP